MKPWVRLAIGGGATLLVGMGIGRFSYTPLIPALIEAGSLSSAQAGYVSAFNLAGYLIGALAALRLGLKWGETRILKSCLLISVICLFASIVSLGFVWLAFWRFLVGITVAVMMIYSLAIVTRHAPPERLGQATGVVFTGVGIGILLSGWLVPALLDVSLAAAWIGMSVIGLLGAIAGFWGWSSVGYEKSKTDTKTVSSIQGPRLSAAILRLIGAQTMFSIGLVPHTIYWVDYLVRGLGHEMNFGGFHWILFGLGAISGTYLWGRLADAVGFRLGLVLVFVALAIGVSLPVVEIQLWALIASSLVVGAQPGFSAIIAGRTHQVVGAEYMPQVWRWMMLTSGVFQAVGGYVYVTLFDFTENYILIFLIGGSAMALGALISLAPVNSRR